ncbi:MAG: transcriptional repressor [Nitrososphaeria archaeon]|jgi:Fe2+ or Zn2+ uptake regulation protein
MIPLRNAIMETMDKNRVLTDDELLAELQKRYSDLTKEKLYQELMKLEILGLIRVYEIGKGKKRVELASGSSEMVGEFDY